MKEVSFIFCVPTAACLPIINEVFFFVVSLDCFNYFGLKFIDLMQSFDTNKTEGWFSNLGKKHPEILDSCDCSSHCESGVSESSGSNRSEAELVVCKA